MHYCVISHGQQWPHGRIWLLYSMQAEGALLQHVPGRWWKAQRREELRGRRGRARLRFCVCCEKPHPWHRQSVPNLAHFPWISPGLVTAVGPPQAALTSPITASRSAGLPDARGTLLLSAVSAVTQLVPGSPHPYCCTVCCMRWNLLLLERATYTRTCGPHRRMPAPTRTALHPWNLCCQNTARQNTARTRAPHNPTSRALVSPMDTDGAVRYRLC